MNFENLRVYQLFEQLTDEIWDIVLGWNNFAEDTVGEQIKRLKPVIEKLSPSLNACLSSIGRNKETNDEE